MFEYEFFIPYLTHIKVLQQKSLYILCAKYQKSFYYSTQCNISGYLWTKCMHVSICNFIKNKAHMPHIYCHTYICCVYIVRSFIIIICISIPTYMYIYLGNSEYKTPYFIKCINVCYIQNIVHLSTELRKLFAQFAKATGANSKLNLFRFSYKRKLFLELAWFFFCILNSKIKILILNSVVDY